jgi:hypothetical protein
MTSEEMWAWIKAESDNWYRLFATESGDWSICRRKWNKYASTINLGNGLTELEAMKKAIEAIKQRAIENSIQASEEEWDRLAELKDQEDEWFSKCSIKFPDHNELCRLVEKLSMQDEQRFKEINEPRRS